MLITQLELTENLLVVRALEQGWLIPRERRLAEGLQSDAGVAGAHGPRHVAPALLARVQLGLRVAHTQRELKRALRGI